MPHTRLRPSLLGLACLLASASSLPSALAADPVSEADLAELGVDAYVYAYPMILMDVSRKVMTNVEAPDPRSGIHAPVNQFAHVPAFPDASFTDVVRPNADTLYSSLWFDVTKEPLIIHVPDSGGRYYLLPMLDLWSDVFASPGKRTSGTGPQVLAIVGPRWEGSLEAGIEVFRSPTSVGWMIGRTQTNGKNDYDAVHKFQSGLTAIPLSAWGKLYTPKKGKVDPAISPEAPVKQVAAMEAYKYFGRFAELLKDNPPHPNDYPILQRLKRIGIEPGKPFDLDKAAPEIQKALEAAPAAAMKKIEGGILRAGRLVNSWRMITPPVGTYGTAYLERAAIAFGGLGANVPEDAIYPTAVVDADGQTFDSARRYVLKFAKDEVPPVRAFWSLTMYNAEQFFADNPINRYAIGDRDALRFESDGSLVLYIQRESPGKERESNWLPAPKAGAFTMNLRLYWPKPAALEGTWRPPAVRKGN